MHIVPQIYWCGQSDSTKILRMQILSNGNVLHYKVYNLKSQCLIALI